MWSSWTKAHVISQPISMGTITLLTSTSAKSRSRRGRADPESGGSTPSSLSGLVIFSLGWRVHIGSIPFFGKRRLSWPASPARNRRRHPCHLEQISSRESTKSFVRSAVAPWASSTRRCTRLSDAGSRSRPCSANRRRPELAARFEREARAASAIGQSSHRRCLRPGGRTPEGLLFMAMELLDGQSLASVA